MKATNNGSTTQLPPDTSHSSESGMLPLSWLLLKSSLYSHDNQPIDAGIVPEKALLLRERNPRPA